MKLRAIAFFGLAASASACATAPVPATGSFEAGTLRLRCELDCAWDFGLNRAKMRTLYRRGQWSRLAAEVERLGYRTDVAYYYLGSAAEGLGHDKAARQYFQLALRQSPCDRFSPLPDVCDGLKLPDETHAALARIALREAALGSTASPAGNEGIAPDATLK